MFFFFIFLCFGFHILGNPYVGSHYAAFSDGDATEDGGIGVDDDIIFEDRVARDSLDRIAVLIERETLGSEGYTLVEFHIVADDAGSSNHHTRTVVDGEVLADGSLRVNINTGFRMRQLSHHSRNERHSQFVQYMGDAVVGNCLDDRVAGDDFSVAHGSRVALVGSLYIGSQNLAQSWKFHDYLGCNHACLGTLVLQFCLGFRFAVVGEAETCENLL